MASNNKTGTNKTNAPALPSLDAIEAVAVTELPAPASKAGGLSDDEKALAAAIVTAGSDGNAARGPKLDTREAATSAAARIKRLVRRFLADAKTDPMPDVTSRVVARDDGYAWAIIITPHVDEDDAAPATEPVAAGS